jgi:hypothetical protein
VLDVNTNETVIKYFKELKHLAELCILQSNPRKEDFHYAPKKVKLSLFFNPLLAIRITLDSIS